MTTKKIRVHISQDRNMIISEWIQFGISSFIVLSFLWASLRYISTLLVESQVLALIVLLLVFTKVVSWVRFPKTFQMDRELIQEIDWAMEERKKNAKD